MKRISGTVRKGAAVCLDRRHNTLQKLLGISLPRAAAMDEHKEKAEDKFQESPEQHQLLAAKEEPEGSHEEPVDQQQHQAKMDKDGRKAQEAAEEPTVQHQLKQVVETTTEEEEEEEETSSSPSVVLSVLAHPCSLLQYLLRACAAWCWRLHGAFDDGPNPKPQQAAVAVAPAPPEAEAAPANSSGPGGGGGEKANYFHMQDVVTRVWAVRRGRPPPGGPRHPREGPGGNGGSHN